MRDTRAPRAYITQAAFVVAPDLVGLPLAHPLRRLAAMLLDLFFVLLLTRSGGFFLGAAAAVVLFRAITTRPGEGRGRGTARTALRFAGAIVLFITVWQGVRGIAGLRDREETAEREEVRIEGDDRTIDMSELGLSPLDIVGKTADFTQLERATTQQDATAAARRLVERLREKGVAEEKLLAMRRAVADDSLVSEDDSLKAAALLAALPIAAGRSAGKEPETPPSLDSLEAAYAAALEAGDDEAKERIRSELADAAAGARIGELKEDLRELDEDRDDLSAALERERERGILSGIGRLADEMGLGFGWTGLYFTAFLALWRGQTPGKRILGIRVVRLDGKPIGWWAAFERFGGYAAAIFTGLLGFAQILWDRNRQGIHDKITETVVVREEQGVRSSPRPAL